jgi:DNA-binding CsgD family transcriptional regulator
MPADVEESIMRDVRRGRALQRELRDLASQYSNAAIARRHNLHRRTVQKVIERNTREKST